MISHVKNYARTRLNSLGYQEWSDGFNKENIPSSLLNTTYQLIINPCKGISNNQDNQVIECPISVYLFIQSVSDPRAEIDSATTIADSVISDFLKSSNRTTFSDSLKNIRFDSLSIDPIDDSNDNGVEIKIDFTALVIISTR